MPQKDWRLYIMFCKPVVNQDGLVLGSMVISDSINFCNVETHNFV